MSPKLGPRSEFTSASGLKLPVIGLGTALIRDETAMKKALNTALEIGYPLIDTAFMYKNEQLIGKVLKERMDDGKLRRGDIFVTTKLPPEGNNPQYVKKYLETQLKDLQLDYVDLYLIHFPVGLKPDANIFSGSECLDMTTDLVALWKEMEKMVDAGLTKYIGLSNFNVKQMERIMEIARIKPSNLQIELYIYQQAREQQEYCKKNGITITSYSTLGSMGFYTDPTVEKPEELVKGVRDNPLTDTDVLAIAKNHNKTPAQVLLRHMVQSGIAVIPKTCTPERMKENFDIFDFQLSKPEMLRLGTLDRGNDGRRFVIVSLSKHPEYPY